MKLQTLDQADLTGKTVFYRPDYNVPLDGHRIVDDFRITATFATLEQFMEAKCRIIIGTHLGRPDGKPDPAFELRPVAERLAERYPESVVRLAHQLEHKDVARSIELMHPGDILMLPNLRFYPGEEANDKKFAQTLATLAEIYVNDAFACDHRAHASIVGVPALLPAFAGLLLQSEIEHLKLIRKPEHPFVVVMGGAKVSDKIELIKSLGRHADRILIGGAMANTFLLAEGEEVSDSLVEKDKVSLAKDLMQMLGDKLLLAADYVKGDEKDGRYKYLDIGPQAIKEFKDVLKGAKTVFWNGSLGRTEDAQFAVASEEIARFIAGLKGAHTVIAGGDTVETITKLGLHDDVSFVSTGGGAALEYLAGKELPGIKVLEKN